MLVSWCCPFSVEVVHPKGRSRSTSLLKTTLLSCCKALRTNLKMHFRSLKWGREHICHISSPSKHAGGFFFSAFLSFSLLLAYWNRSCFHPPCSGKSCCCSNHTALITVNGRYMTNPSCEPLKEKKIVINNMAFVWKTFLVLKKDSVLSLIYSIFMGEFACFRMLCISCKEYTQISS